MTVDDVRAGGNLVLVDVLGTRAHHGDARVDVVADVDRAVADGDARHVADEIKRAARTRADAGHEAFCHFV